MKYKLFPWLIGFLLLLVIFFASFSAPALTQLDPAEKQNKVTFNAPFTLHFSQIMNRESVEDSFMLLPKIDGSFRWKDFKTLEFIPDTPLAIGDEYRILIKGGAKSIWMKKIGYDTTIDYLVTGPPYVLFTDPAEASIITKDGAITVMFDRPMDWSENDEKDLIQIEPSASGKLEFLGMSAFQFIPKKLASGQSFKLTIPAGLIALDGGETDKEFSWTLSSPDLKAIKSNPQTGASEVAVNEIIQITFDGDVQLEGIKPGINALLYPSNDLDADVAKKMDGFFNTEVTYLTDENGDAQKNVLVFAPTFDYQPGENYRFVLKSDKDLPLEENFELNFLTTGTSEYKKTEDITNDTEGETTDIENVETKKPQIEPQIEFFIRGENPRLKLDKALTEPAILSACQVSSNEFIRLSSRRAWNNFECDTDSVTINPVQKDSGLVINLNDYFKIDWVTGIYFASVTQGEKKTVRHFLIEDSVLLMKRSDSDLLIWALDVKSGEPIPGMNLEILDYDGEEIARGITDEMGVASINQAFNEGIYVRAKKDKDDVNRWGLVADRWTFGNNEEEVSQEHSGLFVYLNQSIFAPGEVIQIKGIWRSLSDYVLSLPESTQVTLILEDLEHNFLASKRIPMRRNGSFDGTIMVPEDSPSGYFLVSIADINQQRLSNPVPVQIKSGDSDLRLEWIEADNDHIADSTPVYIAKARYKNGIPAAKVNGYFELFRKPAPLNHQEGAISFSFAGVDEVCTARCGERTLVNRDSFEFDLNGEAKFLLTEEGEKFLSAGYDYDIQITASLPGGNPTSINHSFKVHQGSFDLGLGLKHALIQVNEAIDFSLITLNHEGKMEAEKKVKLSLVSRNGEKTVYEENFETDLRPITNSISIAPTMEDGVYVLRAKSLDEKRNEILTEQLVYVSTNPLLAVDDELLLAADQQKYFVGGRAHLLVNEPTATKDNPIPVIITYEREGLLGYETLELTDPVTRITVPIKESMMPYFIVTVTRFNRGISPSFNSSSQKIQVGNDESKIYIDLTYEPSQPKPGEEITLKFRTYDYQQRPLSSVITVNLLNQESSFPAFSYESFFPRTNQILKAASNISLQNQEEVIPKFPNEYESFFLNSYRSSYFDPLITTTAGGESEITFTLPEMRENLYIQVLATKDTGQFGSLSSVLKMNQQLQIQPILPSFVIPGDQTIFAASVKNISDLPVQSRLEFSSPDVSARGDSSRNFSLQPGQQTEISFSVFIDNTLEQDNISVKFQSGDDFTDAVIPVHHLKSSLKIVGSGLLGDIWTGRISLPKEAYSGLGNLQLSMSGGPLTHGKVQSEALDNYAYESNYLLAAKLLSKLSFLPDLPTEDDLASIQSLIALLLKSADEKGAYRFWNEASASTKLTALVLLAYSESSSKGIHIDSIQLNRTMAFLEESLDKESTDSEDKTFILWILGRNGQYDTERALKYFKERETLSIKGQAFLLMNLNQLVQASQNSMSAPFATLKAELIDEALQEDEKIYYDISSETTAIVLYSLSELDSDNPLLEKMANYLVAQGTDWIRELDPAEALWTILALTSYSHQSDTSGINYIAQVKLNGTLVLDQSVTAKSAKEVYQTKVDATLFSSNDINDIFSKKDGTGPLYLDAYLTSFLNPTLASRTEDGMILVRKLYELTDDGKKIPATSFKKGKNYVSELTVVVPENTSYVVLTDEIPAGMKSIPDTMNLDSSFSQKHLATGRITYYTPHLTAGIYRITTQLQAVLEGSYLQLPATAQVMFDPLVLSRTEGGEIQITE